MNDNLPVADPRSLRQVALIGAGVFTLVVAVGAGTRLLAARDLQQASRTAGLIAVSVVQPTLAEGEELVLPGRLQAWFQAPVYARTDGYLKQWRADIGAPVKAGQVLAEIDAPELDQQLAAARAALATATAQRDLAQVTAARWSRLVSEDAVSRQEADERQGDLAAREAMRKEAAANVARLESLAAFKRIVAPFDGVVTSRDTDVGALIRAGGASSSPLFTVSDVSRLRLYVSVPQNLAGKVRPGLVARFTTPEAPDEVFEARLTRSAEAVDQRSGAMLIQLEVDNRHGRLKPGAYAEVTMSLEDGEAKTASTAVRIPANALLFRREGAAVAVVDASNHVRIRPVRIARDNGADLEISSGLSKGDWIMASPPDAIAEGDAVRPVRNRGDQDARS